MKSNSKAFITPPPLHSTPLTLRLFTMLAVTYDVSCTARANITIDYCAFDFERVENAHCK